jgi:dihydrofolate reductase
MGIVRSHISISLDGYAAGPNQGTEQPLGERGEELHEWVVELDTWRKEHGKEGGVINASSEVVAETIANVGAEIMGRGKFGGGPGPWREDPSWEGWWGDDPPFHVPVFVLTHHEREPLEMQGGTTFHFVTDGPEAALERAREAAGDRDVTIGGGAKTIDQYLRLGLLDEFEIHVTPLILGSGSRLLEDVGDLKLELARAVDAPGVTHLRYRVVK